MASAMSLRIKEHLITEKTCSKLHLVIMRFFLALLSGFAVLGALPAMADEVLPPRFNFDRYTRMTDHSPFAIATAVALPEATPDFAKDLYVANAARSPEGDMATIMSSADQNFKKYLNTKEPVDGYSIASIEWSEKVGETKVTISKDGKSATLTFNQALLSQAAPASPPAAGQMPTGVAMIPQPGAGKASRAHSRGVIQRNPKAVAAAASTPNPAPTPSSNLEPPSPEQLEQQATAAAAQLQLQLQQQQQPRIKQPGEP
ncbi:MAG: hypothetical protein DME62_00580 [Verrucomicrobia bacterium]|nr:MAG: hypothetical protein DME62_00580 [Verrucomicrobiota bacterium]